MRVFWKCLAAAVSIGGIVAAIPASSAESGHLPLVPFTRDDGLPDDRVDRIVLDSRGFLWSFHRNGLARFDGRRFRAYGERNGLPPGPVTDLLETGEGRTLVATSRGIYRLEPRGDKRLFVPLGPAEEPPALLALSRDKAGTIWAGGPGGLYRVVVRNRRVLYESVPFLRQTGGDPPATAVVDLLVAQDGSLWIASRRGLVRRTDAGVLVRYDNRDGLPSTDVRAIEEDDAGCIWVGTTGGLARLSPGPAGGPVFVGPVWRTRAELPAGFVFDLHHASDGTMWIAATNLVALVPSDGNQWVTRTWSSANGLTQDAVTALATDASGNLWIGTESAGLMRLTRGGMVAFGWREGIAGPRIGSIVETLAGEICVTTVDRFFCGVAGRFREVPLDLPAPLSWGWYQNVLQDHRGEWWFATRAGLVRFGVARAGIELAGRSPSAVYTTRDGLSADTIFRLYEDSRGDVWIGTISTGTRVQLARWERRTGRIHAFSPEDGFPIDAPTAFREDAHGQLWIGLYDGGLLRLRDGRFDRFDREDGVPPGFVRAIHLAADGTLWVGTNPSGAFRIEHEAAERPSFVPLETTGCPPVRPVTSIVEDSEGRLYLGTDHGLVRCDPATGHAWHYGAVDGLPNGFVNVALRDRAGTLWFGTLQGLARLVPSAEQGSPPPTIFIDRVRVAGRDLPVSELGQLQVETADFPHDRNRVRIEFGSLGYRAGSLPRFRYRLLGGDGTWSEPRDERVVEFASLAPGTYRFEVEAVDAEGRTSPRRATFAFRIMPPLWQRGWFLALAALMVVAAVGTGYTVRIRALERHRRELARQVAERTAELRAAKRELEEANATLEERVEAGIAALREAERMAAYGNLVAAVAHEIRHPIFALQAAAYVLADRLRGRDDLARQLLVLERETTRMGALMDDLLAFARPGDLELAPTDLGGLVEESLECDRQTHGDTGPQVRAEVPRDLPLVHLDRRRLVEVLVNLLENARRHADGVTRILVTARLEQAPGDAGPGKIVLSVTNDGAPIPAERLPRLFEPFYTSGRGTGLGLAIVRRIVRAHRGEITVESTAERGTTFRVVLPARGSADS